MEREKRKYTKRKKNFWFEGGKREVFAKLQRLSIPDYVTDECILPENDVVQDGSSRPQSAPEEIATCSGKDSRTPENLQKRTTVDLTKILFNLTGKPVKKMKKALIIDKILACNKMV